MYYIAYGSNLNLDQMKWRCPNSHAVCNGIVKDYRLVFNVHADIVPEKGCEVPVLLWNIDEEDWDRLDRYEGFPRYYTKEEIDVDVNGMNVPCVVYVMATERKGYSMPYKEYYNVILKGYEQNGMDKSYLIEALKHTERKEQEEMNNETYTI